MDNAEPTNTNEDFGTQDMPDRDSVIEYQREAVKTATIGIVDGLPREKVEAALRCVWPNIDAGAVYEVALKASVDIRAMNERNAERAEKAALREACGLPPEPGAIIEGKPDAWQPAFTLGDAFEERPPVEEIVEGLHPVASVSLLCGNSGSLKSAVLMDQCCCVATGEPWLSPVPNGSPCNPRKTMAAPVAWINYDNATNTMHERFAAFGRGHGLGPDAPLYYWSFAAPTLDATNNAHMLALRDRLAFLGVRFLVVDNLQTVRGNRDENDTSMGDVVVGFRRLAEALNMAIVIIHHNNKQGTFRGATAIENLVDLVLNVERDGQSRDIIIKAGKTRGADVLPFGATFAFDHKEGTRTLHAARFFGFKVSGAGGDAEIESAILDYLTENPCQTPAAISRGIGEGFGRPKIQRAIERLTSRGVLRGTSGPRNGVYYNIVGGEK